ncbi:RNA polymerase sigma factor [Microbacterium sp. P04]|uniref:RNA polymerase sigma factor n=1 Tax=Microbacterium sp. P04 TaxID=3366947 RepID=UPI003746A432
MVPGNDRRSDRQLLEAAAGRDEHAFWAFYHRHAEVVFSAALDALGDEDEAQEVAQEVFQVAWRKASKVRLVAGSAEAWLMLTCRNLVANKKRSIRRKPPVEGLDRAAANMLETRQAQRARDVELLARVEEEIADMPHLDQHVYRAVLVEGRSYDETAAALDISVPSVGKRLNRVRARIRERFGEDR